MIADGADREAEDAVFSSSGRNVIGSRTKSWRKFSDLGPIEPLMQDPSIRLGILVNGAKEVYVERGGASGRDECRVPG